MTPGLPKLTDRQRRHWDECLKMLMTSKGFPMRTKVFLGVKGAPSKENVVKFCKGDPGAINGFLVLDEGKKGRALEDRLGLPKGDLLRRFYAIASGVVEEETVKPWHPSFHGVGAEQVEIPAPFDSPLGSTAEEVAAAAVKSLANRSDAVVELRVVGPEGSGRRTLARQLEAAIKTAWAQVRPSGSPNPITVVVDTSNRLSSGSKLVVRPRPWGREEAIAVLDRLAATDHPQANAARTAADQLRTDPSFVVSQKPAGKLIEWLADALEDGLRPDPHETARNGAWRRAVKADPTGALGRLEVTLLERFWARALSSPCCPDWTRLSRDAARDHLESVLTELGRVDPCSVDLGALVAKARKGSPASRSKVLDRLDSELAAVPGERLLAILVETGLLTICEGGVAAPDTDLALSYGARGLAAATDAAPDPRLWVGDQGVRFAQELALAGVSGDAVARWIDDLPIWFALDGCRALVVFSNASASAVPRASLRAAWAATVLAPLVEPVDPGRHGATEPAEVRPALRALSAGSTNLPRIEGADPVQTLLDFTSGRVQELLEHWRSQTTDLNDLTIERRLVDVCPQQRAPISSSTWARLSAREQRMALEVVVHRAPHDPECARVLDGTTIDRDAYEDWVRWQALPLDVRVRWLGRSAGARPDELVRVGDSLIREIVQGSGAGVPYLDQVAQPELDPMVDALLDVLGRQAAASPLTPLGLLQEDAEVGLRIRLAGRRRDFTELQELAERAIKTLGGLTLRVMGQGCIQVQSKDSLGGTQPTPNKTFQFLNDLRQRLDLIHESAAVELYRLGEREVLRDRWQAGLAVRLPLDILEQERTASVVAVAQFLPPDVRTLLVAPLPEESAQKFLVTRTAASRRVHAAELEQVAERLGGEPDEATRLAARLLDALDGHVDAADVPEDLREWFSILVAHSQISPTQRTRTSVTEDVRQLTWAAEHQARERAEKLLLMLEDREPVQRWLQDAEDPYPSATVHDWLRADPSNLEVAWDLAQGDEQRSRVIRVACRLVERGTPAPSWFVTAARGASRAIAMEVASVLVPEPVDPFFSFTSRPPRASKSSCEHLVRHLIQTSKGPRERCWWGSRLHDLRPWPDELLDALRGWADEQDPFGPSAEADGDRRWGSDLWPVRLCTLLAEVPADRWPSDRTQELLARVWCSAADALGRCRPFLQGAVLALAEALRLRKRFDLVLAAYRDRARPVLRITLADWIVQYLDRDTLREEADRPEGHRERLALIDDRDREFLELAERRLREALERPDPAQASEWSQVLTAAKPDRVLALLEEHAGQQPELVERALVALTGDFGGPLEAAALGLRQRVAWPTAPVAEFSPPGRSKRRRR